MKQIQQIRVRPGKSGSIVLIVVGSLFFVFGTFLTGAGLADSSERDLWILLWLFRIIWWAVCLSMIAYGVLMVVGKKPPVMVEADIEGKDGEGDFDTRLRKLEALRTEGLISRQEYDNKRTEIIQEKW
ncbi:MAG: hypothetical protein C0392_02260 [Syntrophus sp. (in: bacteria)]|nr:hypothetical protein [Syntrophus sp. (in: bacteria)]